MRLAPQIAAACLLAWASPALPRAFSVDDLLSAEEFGQVAFTPDGRWLVFERQLPFKGAGPFEYDTYPPLRRSRIYVADLASKAPPRLLLQAGPVEGHTAGPISPSGKSMVVLRLKGRDWQAGVVEFATGKVRWLGVIPELAQLGQTIAWRSDDQLVVATRKDIPLRLRAGWQSREVLESLWRASARGEPALTEVSSADAFAGDTTGSGALVLIDVSDGKVRTLARGDFYDLQISPDGRRVAAMANLEALRPEPAPRVVATPNRRRNLLLIDFSSGAATTPCPDCDLSPHLIAWSPNSREVLVHGRRSSRPDAALISLSTHSARTISTGAAPLVLGRTTEGHVIPYAGWLAGSPIAYLAPPGGRADWYQLTSGKPINLTAQLPSAPAPKLPANDGQAIFASAGGAIWRVTRNSAAVFAKPGVPIGPQGFSLSSRERQNSAPAVGWFRAAQAGRPILVSTEGAGAPLSDEGAPRAAMPGASASVVMSRSGSQELQSALRERRIIMTLNGAFSEIDFASVREIKASGPGGAPLTHYLLVPHRPRASPPPLIVIPYPGLGAYPPPRPYGGTGRFPANAELMAAQGYAVLIPALPRPEGIEPGEGLADQILAAVDLAATQAEGFDPARPILWGHSFGGYSVLMAATQSERFAAVIALAAPSNLSSVRGSFDPHGEVLPQDGLSAYVTGWSEDGQAHLRAGPWENPKLYARNSPIFQAGSIKAPVLLIHGDIDFVRLSQAQEMFMALSRQAKDVTLITAYGEGHIVSSPGNVRELYTRALRWLATRTRAQEPGR